MVGEATALFSNNVEVEVLGKERIVSSSVGPDLETLGIQNLRESPTQMFLTYYSTLSLPNVPLSLDFSLCILWIRRDNDNCPIQVSDFAFLLL